MRRWYVIYTKPRQESVAEVNLRNQEFDVWLPRALHSRRRRGRWLESVEPLFPRYLFIRLSWGHDNVAPVRSTRGVSGFVRQGVEPDVVPTGVIEALAEAVDPTTGLHRIRPRALRRGERVRVLEGPFQGLEGIFEAERGEARVAILLGLLGDRRRVLLSRHQICASR